MAFRSIIDIDVNDEKFKKFQDQFQKYNELLKKNPQLWEKTGKAMGGASASAEELAGYLATQRNTTEGLARAARSMEGTFERTRRHVSAITSSLTSAGRQMLQWGGIGGLTGGLLGFGGLWGLSALSGGVSSRRRESMGLGSSYGGYGAFGVAYSRAIDPGTVMGGVSAAMADPRLLAPYLSVGMSQGEMRGDSSEVAARYLSRLRGFAQRTSPSLLGAMSEAYGLGSTGISVEDLRRLGSMSPMEFAHLQDTFGKGKSALGLSSQDQQGWQDLRTQLTLAGQQIENVLVQGLGRLASPIAQLSQAVTDAVSKILGSNGFKNLMEEAGDGIRHFADFVASPEFQRDVETFARGIGVLAGAVTSAMRWLSDKFGPSPSSASRSSFDLPVRNAPIKMLAAMGMVESGGNPNALSSKGAKGLFQFTDETWKKYGDPGTSPYDPAASARAAIRYTNDLSARFGGDLDKILAAYNWGPSNVESGVKRYGSMWESHLPAETSGYISRVENMMGVRPGTGVNITINNSTGGNAAVVANQASK